MTEKELIKGCVREDVHCQKQLFELYAGKMMAVCKRYSRHRLEAEDMLQEAFVKVFDNLDKFAFKGSFEGWIKRITVNTALQKYRKKKVYDISNEAQIEDAEVEIEETNVPLDFLLKIIQELPDRYRLVFNLYVLDGYSHKEIADMLGISDGTSKSNLARARMILKTKVTDYNLSKNK